MPGAHGHGLLNVLKGLFGSYVAWQAAVVAWQVRKDLSQDASSDPTLPVWLELVRMCWAGYKQQIFQVHVWLSCSSRCVCCDTIDRPVGVGACSALQIVDPVARKRSPNTGSNSLMLSCAIQAIW